VNSFHVTVRAPPEVLNMVCSYLNTEEDIFSASQVCRHWRGVLVSSPSLWTQFSCDRVSRTVVGLGRCKSMPIQLEVRQKSSSVALEKVLLRGNKIATLTIDHCLDKIPLLRELFTSSRPSVERMHIRCQRRSGWRPDDRATHEIWQNLPSLRELFVCQYSIPIEQLTAPNLVHLALEWAGFNRMVTVQSILDALQGCPRLETLFISHSNITQSPTRDHSPVSLPHIRSIEFGPDEVRSGLTTHLRLPQDIAVGFRRLPIIDIWGNIPSTVVATIQHVLGRIGIHCITFAAPLHPEGDFHILVRFEGPGASLEITTYAGTYEDLRAIFFGRSGVLFTHSPRTENVRELCIIGCHFVGGEVLDHVSAAMPNVVSISFFHCREPQAFVLLPETSPSSPAFPRLERVMVLGPVSGLREMVKTRRDDGVPLKTLAVGRGSEGLEYGHPEDLLLLREFVDELHVGCPTEILEWGTENEIHKLWSTVGIPSPVRSNRNLVVLG